MRVRRGETKAPKKKTKKSSSVRKTFKHGLEVPCTRKDVMRIDAEAGNRRWQEVIEQEVGALVMHECFHFKTSNFKASADY